MSYASVPCGQRDAPANSSHYLHGHVQKVLEEVMLPTRPISSTSFCSSKFSKVVYFIDVLVMPPLWLVLPHKHHRKTKESFSLGPRLSRLEVAPVTILAWQTDDALQINDLSASALSI
jgi:hypothetical protein